jgi:hypothetical protein
MAKPTAPKAPQVKSPFALHAAVTARSNLPTDRAQEVALSPDGARVLVVDALKVAAYDTRTAAPLLGGSALAGAVAHFVAWSPRGDAVATLATEGERGAKVTLWSAVTGGALHAVSLPAFGTFSHGGPGATAPVLVFDDAGATLYVRSTPDTSAKASFVWRVDVATGAAAAWRVPVGELVEAVAPGPDGLIFVAQEHRREHAFGAWRFGEADPVASAEGAFGTCMALAGGRVWLAGHERWAFALDPAALGAAGVADAGAVGRERARALPARAARVDELAPRARGRWYEQYFGRVRAAEATAAQGEAPYAEPQSGGGVRAFVHAEPFPVVQCERLGRGALVRDGVTLCAWSLDGDAVREVRLVEDLQKGAPWGSRITAISAAGGVVAAVWNKTQGGNSALVEVLDVDLAALGLA